ncbi:hypothetical protein [Calditerrivibrio sp.]|uniref:hypothetical protein n=1 Tax=Calditerrivibrio sp. TaxID=2792612 RepID=UPI003D0E9393
MPLLLIILLVIVFFASCAFYNIASAIDHIVTALLKLTLLAGIITLTFFIVRWIRLKDQIISYKNGRDMESNRPTTHKRLNYKNRRQIGVRYTIKQITIQKSDMESNRTTTEQKQNQYKQLEYLE